MKRTRRSAELGRMVGIAEHEDRCIVADSTADRQRLYRAVRAGKLICPAKGLYARPETWNRLDASEQALLMMRGLQHLYPRWVFAESSAAVAYGLWVSYDDLLPVRIAVDRKSDGSRGVLARRIVMQNVRACVENGVRVTSFERTVFDCLRRMDFAHGLAVADSALRLKGWDVERLRHEIDDMPHRCLGWHHAMDTALHADARAESGGESIARARMLLLGYALPDLQVPLQNIVDGDAYRGDFGWRLPNNELIIGELDGHEKYTNESMTKGRSTVEVLSDERLRESRTSAPGVRIMRFSYAEMMDDKRFMQILDAYGVPKARSGLALTAERNG